jgi:imidazolonepropionase-like amidohydrolase/ABC-type multidrug transport system permease subunit
MKAFLALLKIDLKLASRNRSVLFFNYLFPLIFFFMFAQMYHAREGKIILLVVTMVTVIGILGNGLWGAGMRAVQEREENILRRYKVTPITPVPLLAASMITGVIIYLPSVLLMLLLAAGIYGMSIPASLGSYFLFVCLGAIAIRSIGLIIAAVVNSNQEAQILINLIYMPMLLLSGATVPLTFMPGWLQTITQFIPATYVTTGVSRILQGGESIAQNWRSATALLICAALGLFIATKLFRWEKEEKLRATAKLWVAAALIPFLFLGVYQAWSKQELTKAKILDRQIDRGRTWLVQNARIFVGNGKTIENGSVLIKQGKIAEVYEGAGPAPESLSAKALDAAGKTVLPGLIDMHIHLGATGGFPEDPSKGYDPANFERELAAYLYCGITAVRSAGDPLDKMIALRKKFDTGEKLGAELFFCGPLFTAEDGHGTEYARFMPENLRASFLAQFVRIPKSPAEAKSMVDEVAGKGVDFIKGILESGVPDYPFNRMDVNLLRAVAEEAHAKNLPVSVHTGKAVDVDDAIRAGANSIEHGSFADEISDNAISEMKTRAIVLDPTLSVAEGLTSFGRGDTSLLQRSLVQQVTTKELLTGSEKAASAEQYKGLREGLRHYPISVETGTKNLLEAWHAGVTLVTGTDAGNYYVLHGPTVQHEIELWVAAGIPIEVALEAATNNAAKLLRANKRIGTVEKGKEASLLIVDGNPLQDVKALSSISAVFFKGERVTRSELLEQK